MLNLFFKASFKNFVGHESFLWDHWFPCFGLLVTSPLGFKAKEGSLIHTWQRNTWYISLEIHLWCDTCRPLSRQHSNQAFSSTYLQPGIGGARTGDLSRHRRTLYWLSYDGLDVLQCYSQSCWLAVPKNPPAGTPPPPRGRSCWRLPLTANGHFSVPQELYQSKSWNGRELWGRRLCE